MSRCATVGLSMLAGAVLGGAAVQSLHAQAKPPAYVIAEVAVRDQGPFEKEYIPRGMQAIQAEGGNVIVHPQKAETLMGSPPTGAVFVIRFDNLDKAHAYWTSEARKNAFAVGEKYATFRYYAVEGASP